MSYLISVGMAVFNCEKTLESSIKSIIWQTYENWELILINDGSDDATLHIAQQFQDPRIKVTSDEKRKGLAYRLNQAISLSSGQYFARMDGDDIAHPRRFEAQLDFLISNPNYDLVGSRVILFNNKKEILGCHPYRKTHQEICSNPYLGFYLPHPSWMGKITWFRKYQYNITFLKCQDQELLVRSYRQSLFFSLEQPYLAYRRNFYSIHKVVVGRLLFCKALLLNFIKTKQLELLLGLPLQGCLIAFLFLSILFPLLLKKIKQKKEKLESQNISEWHFKEWTALISKIS